MQRTPPPQSDSYTREIEKSVAVRSSDFAAWRHTPPRAGTRPRPNATPRLALTAAVEATDLHGQIDRPALALTAAVEATKKVEDPEALASIKNHTPAGRVQVSFSHLHCHPDCTELSNEWRITQPTLDRERVPQSEDSVPTTLAAQGVVNLTTTSGTPFSHPHAIRNESSWCWRVYPQIRKIRSQTPRSHPRV